jgi:hypothetical protein
METFKVACLGALGSASCVALLLVAGTLTVRWKRLVIAVVALGGFAVQGLIWSVVTHALRSFNVGGSYFLLYAAIAVCVAGSVWALVLLGASIFGRRTTGRQTHDA